VLNLEENQIHSLVNIERVQFLQKLFLSGNKLRELGEALDKISQLSYLEELTLSHNVIARRNNYRVSVLKKLPLLKVLDKAEIKQEERERLATTHKQFYLNKNLATELLLVQESSRQA